MTMPGRSFTASTRGYRYGFNGQEKSTEINSDGNLYNAEYWEYDSRIVRRWNIDPVLKPWQSGYSVLSNSPIWKMDPNGDDDFFNANGTFAYRTKTGTNIRIITKTGTYLLSQFQPNSPANIKGLVKIINYYRPQTGIPNNVQLGISPTTPNRGGGDDASLAFTNRQGISVSAKNGINASLNNYNNLVNTLVHEEKHREAGDPEKENYKFTDHTSVFEKQMDDKTFKNTDNTYKTQNATKYVSYLLGALQAEEIDDKEFNKRVDNINKKLQPYGVNISYSYSSAELPAVLVYGKDNNGNKIATPDFVNPAVKPQ